ncbi:lipoprotein LpqV [Candidatus Mycobacterium wuenschmannii]|uniref:Lipoprotein LpqV n=1 Tax=Candidatus Mycobacterium wuenschmannii TaxID=3027808 RepID=A0ABY8W4U0_9MYCO|nr:lipoprotein LpqV [Candidatus Mycobacterium wuenschmannii]WIM90072.1 lipoprotein LpqV [Candidatus Mycobacterium wuenschmannii]
MWPRPTDPSTWIAAVLLTVAAAVAGCSTRGPAPAPAPAPPSRTTAPAAPAPGAVSTNPAGVTTKIDVPAHSTEEEYFQACHAATVWMQAHPGDRRTLAEDYLAAVQVPGVVGPGTWNIAWAALPLARQAGVIVAAQAAAGNECG